MTDDELIRLLELADPALVDDPAPVLGIREYRDALDTRGTPVTLIDREPAPTQPTSGRGWSILLVAAAAVVLVVGVLVVVDRYDSKVEAPAAPPSIVPSTTTVDSSPTGIVVQPLAPIDCGPDGCPWSPELTAQRLDPAIFCGPPGGAWCLAVSPEGTLVALDPVDGTLTWYEDVPRVVPLAVELDSRVGHSGLAAIGPHAIAYLAIGPRPSYIVAVAPSGAEITRVDTPYGAPSLYPTATGLSSTAYQWPKGDVADGPQLWVPWVDLDGNPITDTRPYPTATVTDAGIEVRHEERDWLVTGEPWSDDSGLDIFRQPDGGVLLRLFVYGGARQQVLVLSTGGTIERYSFGIENWPRVLPDGSWIVEHNSQLVRLTPPASPPAVVSPLVDIRSRLSNDVELFRMKSDTGRYWRVTTLSEFDGRRFAMPSRALDPVDSIESGVPEGRTIRQQIQILALTGTMVPAVADVYQVEPNADLLVIQDAGALLKRTDLVSGEQFTIVSVAPDFTPAELRAATTDNPPDEFSLGLPDDVPDTVYDIAADVTAGATTDYDRLLALQNWFRNNFDYSTEVQSGHGNDAIENFLQIRTGYCEQFAATFAVMARTLGIPSRVAVGYTLGQLRSDGWYSVFGRNAHAWPEIWFDGIGWVPFEPTPLRGKPGAED